VKYHTDGKGNYVTTAMEDTGTLQSLTFLARAGRVDISRVMVLRTASDFDQPVPGRTAAESLAANKIGEVHSLLSGARSGMARRPGSRQQAGDRMAAVSR
jgi:purine nucleoside permease